MSETAEPDREAVLDAMHDVIDPELGYNIVDLGLIYDLQVKGATVKVVMTMTTPGCPAQDYIMSGVRERGMQISGIEGVDINLVWNPPWSVKKMSPVAKEHFGIGEDMA